MKYFWFILIFGLGTVASFSQPTINSFNSVVYFPVTHNIITLDNGNGGMDTSEIPLIMAELNRAFAPAGIQFFLSCKKNINIKFFTRNDNYIVKKYYICIILVNSFYYIIQR